VQGIAIEAMLEKEVGKTCAIKTSEDDKKPIEVSVSVNVAQCVLCVLCIFEF
jgi:hypothetical protein